MNILKKLAAALVQQPDLLRENQSGLGDAAEVARSTIRKNREALFSLLSFRVRHPDASFEKALIKIKLHDDGVENVGRFAKYLSSLPFVFDICEIEGVEFDFLIKVLANGPDELLTIHDGLKHNSAVRVANIDHRIRREYFLNRSELELTD